MPYKTIVFVKLLWKELLLEDDRFTDKCNDEQKGLYLMLLLLAGATNNNIPESENYLKRTLNLSQSAENIAKNRDCLLDIFPKLVKKDGYLKFRKFKQLHNYIRNVPSGTKSTDSGTPRIDKIRIDKIREEYASLKNLSLTDFSSGEYARTGKAIKTLIGLAQGKDELIIDGLRWCAKQPWCDWKLETLIKRWADFKASKKEPKSRYREL